MNHAPCTAPAAPSAESRHWITPALRAALIDRAALECAALGCTRIALFGAGSHTRSIGTAPFERRGLDVVAILDDQPAVVELFGLPVITPQDASSLDIDAVVVSSDAHEPALLERCATVFGSTGPAVVPIYAAIHVDDYGAGSRLHAMDVVGPLAARACAVPGDLAEMGVYNGGTFGGLLQIARAQGRACHAFDTFAGMPDPGPLDPRLQDGSPAHPEGQFDIGGVENFPWNGAAAAVMWPGLIPQSFTDVPAHQTFCYVRLDLDNHEPTLAAARWAWPRIPIGGCLSCHDYDPGNGRGAAGALDIFLAEVGHHIDGLERQEAWVFKRSHT